MTKRIGIVLSGCGVFDGAEIHEAVLTLLAVARNGATAICMAPDVSFDVVDHITKKPTGERRSVLIEAARLARGSIAALGSVDPSSLDGVIFPGGFGAAKNLSTFAAKGADAEVLPEVARLVRSMHEQRKPIGAVCIAPAVIAAIFKGSKRKVSLTIGDDVDTAKAIEACGAVHAECRVDGVVVDEVNLIVSTPAYMLGPGISDVAVGIEKLVDAVLARAPTNS